MWLTEQVSRHRLSPISVIRCHLWPLPPPRLPLLLPLQPPQTPSLPQRKPAIQSGMELKSLGAWPGPRPLANEVGERQPKSLPLGLYCLYRGLVIGGYSSGIKRLLPQPLRRVRHSLPPPPPPSNLFHSPLPIFLPSHHASVLSTRKRREWLLLPSCPPSACLPPSVSARCLLGIVSVRQCVCWRAGCWFSFPTHSPTRCCLAQWFCGCWLCRSHGRWYEAGTSVWFRSVVSSACRFF